MESFTCPSCNHVETRKNLVDKFMADTMTHPACVSCKRKFPYVVLSNEIFTNNSIRAYDTKLYLDMVSDGKIADIDEIKTYMKFFDDVSVSMTLAYHDDEFARIVLYTYVPIIRHLVEEFATKSVYYHIKQFARNKFVYDFMMDHFRTIKLWFTEDAMDKSKFGDRHTYIEHPKYHQRLVAIPNRDDRGVLVPVMSFDI